MRRLYRRLAATFLGSTLVIAMLFAASLYERSRAEHSQYLNQLLESVSANFDSAAEDRAERLSLCEEDYLHRASMVEYILADDFDAVASGGGLSVLRELLDVRGVSVLDASGEVMLCAGEAPPRTDLSALLAAPDEEAFEILADPPRTFSVVVRSDSDRFAAVRLDADASALGLMSREELIRATLARATTEYDTAVAAVGADSGEMLGITENNRQQFDVAGASSPRQLLDFLASAAESGTRSAVVNGERRLISVLARDGFYLAAFSSMDGVFAGMARTFAEGLLGVGVIGLLTFFLVHYHISRMERALSRAQTEAKFDKLTGLYNRSGFEQRAEDFLAQDSPCGVLMLMDLDNFKRVNDGEGHPEGDRILKQFAECLSRAFRKSDCVGRLGGDEFIALIPNRVPDAILREKLEALLISARGALGPYRAKYGLSVSIGAVPVDGSVRSYAALYRYADAALYLAKSEGKDRFYINRERIVCTEEGCSVYGKQALHGKEPRAHDR